MQRFHRGPDDDGVRRLLFGDLQVEPSGVGRQLRAVSIVSARGRRSDCWRTLPAARSAGPSHTSEIAGLCARWSTQHSTRGRTLTAALRVGYRAVLCSPRFLYLTETPGQLDDHAIAARLSYLLTGSTPDEQSDATGRRGPLARARGDSRSKSSGCSPAAAAAGSSKTLPPSGSTSIRSTSPSPTASSIPISTRSCSTRCSTRRTRIWKRCSATT